MANLAIAVLLLALGPLCFQCKPMGGRFSESLYLNESAAHKQSLKANGTCLMNGLLNSSTISIQGTINVSSAGYARLVAKLFKVSCANYLQIEKMVKVQTPCANNPGIEDIAGFEGYAELKAQAVIERKFKKGELEQAYKFAADMVVVADTTPTVDVTTESSIPTTSAATPAAEVTTPLPAVAAAPPTNETKRSVREAKRDDTVNSKSKTKSGNSDKTKTGDKEDNSKDESHKVGKREVVFEIGTANSSESGIYLLQVYLEPYEEENIIITASLDVEMHNPYGLLSAIDYPALIFYGVMTSVYAIFGIAWIIMMLCSFNDLVRLQFWVMAVIILGFLEKTFFVAEYSAINLGSDTSGSFMIAEFVSAVKRGLSRMLLIIVSMGFGTVKPRLGDSLFKVVAAGVLYFALALVDGIMRARNDTFHTNDTSSVVTLALLLLLDTFIFYWIFISIVDTRRTLRLRKNYVKLSMYNHFAYTLIFAILATLGFVIWSFVVLEYPSGMCLTDWGEVWLRDCFWHVLFAFILLVVMWIWRPSSNRSRFAYSLVADNDEEEVVFEQGSNKNFDSVKMRAVNKPTDQPPPVPNQAEDDLRWVEENLPTTAMDKAIPLLVDSDEEVMTTKFEISKMN